MDKSFDYFKSVQALTAKAKHNKIIRFFPDSDLRSQHTGLRKLALENKIDPWNLEAGEFLVFANKSLNRLKIYAPGNIIAYVKSPDNRRIDLHIVRLIPRFFNGTEFNYSGALKEIIDIHVKK